jgi:hypothetical protein
MKNIAIAFTVELALKSRSLGELQGLKNLKLIDSEIFPPLPGGVSNLDTPRVGTVGGQIIYLALEIEESLKRIYAESVEVLFSICME